MKAENLGLIELIFTFTLVLIFAIWQWISLRRDNKKAAAEKKAKQQANHAATNQEKK